MQNKKHAREVVTSEQAPPPIGLDWQAIMRGGLVFVSSQIALDPATGKPLEETKKPRPSAF